MSFPWDEAVEVEVTDVLGRAIGTIDLGGGYVPVSHDVDCAVAVHCLRRFLLWAVRAGSRRFFGMCRIHNNAMPCGGCYVCD